MALLYTIRSAKPTSVEDTTVPQTRSLRQHLLLTWADVSKERPPFYAVGVQALNSHASRFNSGIPLQYDGMSSAVVATSIGK